MHHYFEGMSSSCVIVLIAGIALAIAQELSIYISERKQTVKEGDTIIFRCTLSNPVSGDVLMWIYFRHATGESEFYSTETLLPRIEVTEGVDSDMRNVSLLSIFNATSDDTGLVSCRYTYYDTFTNKTTLIQSVGSVCVTSRPEPPFCIINYISMSEVICTAVSACPDDITLRWFDKDTMEELHGLITVDGRNIENVVATNNETNTYLCKLESLAYEVAHPTCSIKKSPNEMFTPSHKQTTNKTVYTIAPYSGNYHSWSSFLL